MERIQFHRETPRHQVPLRSLIGSVVLAIGSSVLACSGVGPPNKPVVFGDQTNIVIWDEAHHTEHFIRNANFRSGADNFGFIAPTPGKPELNAASNQAFFTLASLAPVRAFGYGGFGGGLGGVGGGAEAPVVKVIQEADVAGYHATTLWSTDAHAINEWMNQHGYVSTPEVEKWDERYTSKGHSGSLKPPKAELFAPFLSAFPFSFWSSPFGSGDGL